MSEEPEIVEALIGRRRELAQQVQTGQRALRQLVIEMDALDSTIHLFDPTIVLEDVKRDPVPPRNHAFRGELRRIIFEALEGSNEPLPSNDVAAIVMRERAIPDTDQKLARIMRQRVQSAIRHFVKRGELVSFRSLDEPIKYAIRKDEQ